MLAGAGGKRPAPAAENVASKPGASARAPSAASAASPNKRRKGEESDPLADCAEEVEAMEDEVASRKKKNTPKVPKPVPPPPAECQPLKRTGRRTCKQSSY